MKKRYELTLSATDRMCCIYDISCEPKELVTKIGCQFIRIFRIQPEVNKLHVQMEFRIWNTIQHDVDAVIELEKAPCWERIAVPDDCKDLPEVFILTDQKAEYLYISEDVAKVSYGPAEFSGKVNTKAPLRNTSSTATISRQISVGLCDVTVTDEISTLKQFILPLSANYNYFVGQMNTYADSLETVRNIFKDMEGFLIDAETLANLWATEDVQKILSFDTRTLRSWKYSNTAKAMGVPFCGDIYYGIVKVDFRLKVIKIRISMVGGKEIEFVPIETRKKPNGYASTVYTVATDKWRDTIFDDEAKAKARMKAMKKQG